ncbi:MAG: flavin reductase [Bacteroidetes bacterium RIFCSPLOWO2_02_FULL_36_8]|nr:MAG: flavin reductase [Bacteroidetes bacterium RIFCSPLOWO2_02_FULL_36_8]OFY69225.1 MAG: flavin reductase [Bacteroidetes bacterium RIFCSPLOWO2_12_FULL_37_12]
MTLSPSKEKTSLLHRYLLASVAPRPIALASTVDKDGNPNLSPFSFFNAFSAKPPILVFSPARRVRDNTLKHTLENIYETREVVINTVNYELVHQCSLSSTEYPKGINEFLKSGLTQIPSLEVKPPRVKESPVQFECKVNQVIELGKEGGAGNLVICEILLMHISDHILDEKGNIDTHKIDLVSRMGYDLYCRASGTAVFEVPKPLTTLGIGIDQLPLAIRNSDILSGNDLGQLGNVETIPTEDEIKNFMKTSEPLKNLFQKFSNDTVQLKKESHLLAKELIKQGKVREALIGLLNVLA